MNRMESSKKLSRITGLLGLVVLVTGSLTHSFNSGIIVPQNLSETAHNFDLFQTKYRIGFISGLLMETVFIFYACMLFYLLKRVHMYCASLMLILALIPAPLFYANQLNHFAAFLSASEDTDQMMFYLNLHKQGGYIISIFFGLWLFPLGLLVYKSKALPRLLGVLLMIGCFGYLVNFVQGFLFPEIQSTLWTNPFLVVTHIAEILLMLWLLIKGIDIQQNDEEIIES